MNKQNVQTSVYTQIVDLMLRLLPLVREEKVFAIHGGTRQSITPFLEYAKVFS